MFTGIVTDIGTVLRVEPREGAALYEIGTRLDTAAMAIGASVACSGVCLTVIDRAPGRFSVQVSNATLDKTNLGGWKAGTPVNLEFAMKLGDELGGHMVTGHVDGLASVERIIPDGASQRLVIAAPDALAPMIATKGSVALDGVSLTVNMVDGSRFSVNIIPHTLAATTLGAAKVGQAMNVEVDVLARYIARQLEFTAQKGL
ncbi:MAG: riboflavin synthase [Rhodospirillales bacterium]|nr:riboflavin synthase [Alphaproteobacteria bacterium]MCB9987166.1 riboflavin synthase [Rhodospirillales bacterium]USO07970.1 MAG: riboflavin synthase [Rhodospirillales bacterium]